VIRVYIIAASALARSGIENLVAGRGISIVGSSASLDAAAEQALEAGADVVLLHSSDRDSESLTGALAASQLASELTAVVLLDEPQPGVLSDLLRAGVHAILPTQIAREHLLAALNAAVAGLVVLDHAELRSLVPEPVLTSSALAELTEPLTPREREVLQMLASGLANKEIAAKLSISDHTAKFHVASILGKLGASTRTEAVAIAIRRGLVLL
jgi:DNA-binding NarL/FixJ family response regulator